MQNTLRFLMKKKVFPLWQITFDSLKKYKKLFINGAKLVFFIRNLRAFLHLLFAGNALRFERLKRSHHLFKNQGQFQIRWQCSRNCPPIVFCPHIWKTKNNLSLQKSRAITVYFWDEVFSFSMPSVCPHLTTVYHSYFSIWIKS